MTRQQAYWRWCEMVSILDQLEELLAEVADDDSIRDALALDWDVCADRLQQLARRTWPRHPKQWRRRQRPPVLNRG